jgi:hypothetical protein
MDKYDFKREIQGVNNTWHKVMLPEAMFQHVSPRLYDLRIYGITSKNDTVEASYLLQLKKEKSVDKEVDFKIINSSNNENGFYFTFEAQSKEALNKLQLDFGQKNFDWKIALQGSQDQQEWFTIVDDYRILSIKNAETNYQFTQVNFPSAKYLYFRLLIRSKEKPELLHAKMAYHQTNEGSYDQFKIKKIESVEHREEQKTSLSLDLNSPAPVSSIRIYAKNTFDYYRPVSIVYVADSLKTEKGYKYNYQTLTSGTLSSMEENNFTFDSSILQKIKIDIYNHDNEPLKIDSIAVRGYVHQLVARFTEPATYFLTYGNKNASKPTYDIERFVSRIPDTLTNLKLGKEMQIEKVEAEKTEPLFKDKNWLWALMAIIIILLGWFSVKMIKSK